jgi:methyl-accepting chemotaxis protein
VINLMRDLRNANDSLATTVEVIQAKSAAVAASVGAIRTQSALLALGLILLAFGLSIVLSMRSAASIARAVKSLSSTGARLAGGDLTHRFDLHRRDEIGVLGQNLDQMLGDLSQSLQKIQAVAAQNRSVRESLLSIAAEATSSAVEIDANSESIKNQMRRIDKMIEENITALGGTVSSINQFHVRMSQQDGHISQSASAVAQMMASIDNINRISEVNRQSAQDLVSESNGSREVFEQTFQTVAEVTENITEIREMAGVIAGIAGQTNILALNAAIEAAHAGEYGMGFAVVADEISKLAAASATNSDEIAKTIATIVEKMQEANTTSVGALAAFGRIASRIQEVSDAITAIWSNVNEMHAGSQQILGAMESLKSTSGDMTAESAQIEASTGRIERSMDDLGKISREITVSVDEIAQGMRLISTSVQSLTRQSETMGELGSELDSAVTTFRTEASDESPA